MSRTFNPTLRVGGSELTWAQVDANFTGISGVANAASATFIAFSQAAMLMLTPIQGDVCWRSDEDKAYYFQGGDPTLLANWASQSTGGGSGTVTSVTGTSPVSVATGTTTPVVSMAKATVIVDGYLAASDFATFAAKGSGTVTGVTASSPLASSGGAAPVISLSGAIPVGNGGTGLASPTLNNVLLGNGASALQTVAPGATGNVLMSNGTTWASAPSATTSLTSDSQRNTKGGTGALAALTSGYDNCAFGYNTLNVMTSGTYNIAIGRSALVRLTTSAENVGIGYGALAYLVNGGDNVGIGSNAMGVLATGSTNVAVGWGAGSGMSLASSNNTAVGASAMSLLASSNYCTAVGRLALGNGYGTHNTGIGDNALYNSMGGSYNVALGSSCAYSVTGGSGNTFLGANWTGPSSSLTNNIVLISGGTARAQFNGTRWNVPSVVEYGSNALAIAAGLVAGDIYRNGDNVCIVH